MSAVPVDTLLAVITLVIAVVSNDPEPLYLFVATTAQFALGKGLVKFTVICPVPLSVILVTLNDLKIVVLPLHATQALANVPI